MSDYKAVNKVGEVPVGELYERVEFDDRRDLVVGEDIVTWDDPDAVGDEREGPEGVWMASFVVTGVVDKIYKRPDGSIEIGLAGSPVGRLSLDSPNLTITNGDRFDMFLNSEYDDYMVEKWFTTLPEYDERDVDYEEYVREGK